MTTRAEIVARARAYLDTPFEHQGRLMGVGVDCAGLVIKVAHDLGLSTFDIDGYSDQPDEETFRATLREQMEQIRVGDVEPGDVLTFHFGKERHMAIVAGVDPIRIIHAWSKVGRVAEHPVDPSMWLRVRGCYRYRGAE